MVLYILKIGYVIRMSFTHRKHEAIVSETLFLLGKQEPAPIQAQVSSHPMSQT